MLIEDIDSILSLRDEIGAVKAPVYIVTRTWKEKKGIGDFTETKNQILPSPRIIDLSHDARIREGGAVKQGDLILKMISKESYQEKDIDLSVTDDKTEKFYLIKNGLYELVSLIDKYVVFQVHLRRTLKKWP